MRYNDSGFSLVEIMVAVAIVGVLAAIAIPNYQKSVEVQKQTLAKANLVALVAAEKSFWAQFNTPTARLDELGWHPTGGMQVYGYGFTGDLAGPLSVPPYQAADTNCYDTFTNDTTCIAGFTGKWQNGPGVKGAASFSTPSFPAALPWLAFARGNLGNTLDDEWSINSAGTLTNTVGGL